MERRNFLKGLLVSASASAGTALVKLASPADVNALATRQPVTLSQPDLDVPVCPFQWPMEKVYMKDRDGQFHAVGFVTEFTMHSAVDEWATWDGQVQLTSGITRADLRFTGPFAR